MLNRQVDAVREKIRCQSAENYFALPRNRKAIERWRSSPYGFLSPCESVGGGGAFAFYLNYLLRKMALA
jgi:hypothetical protein